MHSIWGLHHFCYLRRTRSCRPTWTPGLQCTRHNAPDTWLLQVKDSYTVLLREKKLPLALLEDPEAKRAGTIPTRL